MNATSTITANLNSADCIKSSQQYVQMKYYNICNGQTTVVPMGLGDYVGIIPLTLLSIGVCVAIVCGIVWAIKETFNN